MRLNLIILGFWVLLLTSFQSNSQTVEFENLQTASSKGEPRAQVALAEYYLRGIRHRASRLDLAQYWLHSASDQGYAPADYELGMLYYEGKYLPRNFKEAKKYFSRAAAKDHLLAQFNLARMYERGLGAAKSTEQAIYWYAKAAQKNHAKSQLKLALALLNNEAGSEYHALALAWLEKAQSNQISLDQHVYHKLKKKVSYTELAKAQLQIEKQMQG